MHRLSLRLPDPLHTELVATAVRSHRSLHAQIIFLLESALGSAPAAPESLAEAKAVASAAPQHRTARARRSETAGRRSVLPFSKAAQVGKEKR